MCADTEGLFSSFVNQTLLFVNQALSLVNHALLDHSAGEPRGGCEGAILLLGQYPHPLLYEGPLQVPPERVPLQPAREREPYTWVYDARVRDS